MEGPQLEQRVGKLDSQDEHNHIEGDFNIAE